MSKLNKKVELFNKKGSAKQTKELINEYFESAQVPEEDKKYFDFFRPFELDYIVDILDAQRKIRKIISLKENYPDIWNNLIETDRVLKVSMIKNLEAYSLLLHMSIMNAVQDHKINTVDDAAEETPNPQD